MLGSVARHKHAGQSELHCGAVRCQRQLLDVRETHSGVDAGRQITNGADEDVASLGVFLKQQRRLTRRHSVVVRFARLSQQSQFHIFSKEFQKMFDHKKTRLTFTCCFS